MRDASRLARSLGACIVAAALLVACSKQASAPPTPPPPAVIAGVLPACACAAARRRSWHARAHGSHGLGIVLGIWTRVLAVVFAAFTLATAFLGHRYWCLRGTERHANLLNF